MKNPFRTPTAQELAQRDLEDAERSLLEARKQQESIEAQVSMYERRVARLRHHTAPALALASIPNSARKLAA